jgi:uncharacterized protein (TIGR02466 family)
MADTINLFPLSIYRDHLALNAAYRQDLVQRILKMREAQPGETRGATWTGDVNGFEYLHQDPAFERMFANLADSVRGYLRMLDIDPGKFHLYFTRSWATVSRGEEKIAPHRHEQSHLSLSYYLQKPERSGSIQFHQRTLANEFMARLLSPRMIDAGIVDKRSPINSTMASLDPKEGDVLVFPSKTEHSTAPNLSDQVRISIAIDIILTLRDAARFDAGTPDPRTWKGY